MSFNVKMEKGNNMFILSTLQSVFMASVILFTEM
jgi:hypothetical protein